MMCGKDTPYIQKKVGGCIIIMIVVIIIMAAFIGISGGAKAKVELNGDQDGALIQQSSGVHLFVVNGADLGSKGCKGSWSWSLRGACFHVHFEMHTHCTLLFSDKKKLVKKKVVSDESLQMENLTKEPLAKNPVIVPRIV